MIETSSKYKKEDINSIHNYHWTHGLTILILANKLKVLTINSSSFNDHLQGLQFLYSVKKLTVNILCNHLTAYAITFGLNTVKANSTYSQPSSWPLKKSSLHQWLVLCFQILSL